MSHGGGGAGERSIQVLPAVVINQIAAGEVIERPFSVVKELVENSLDAGATRITVELEGGGSQLLRITDDGFGFSAADLELAFVSHSTSKLQSLADLEEISSLGFRGEALASVGAVSRASIKSRRRGEEGGHELRCQGGEQGEVRPCGCPEGSVVEVRDLFYNVPARRRFLRSERAERARCQDLLLRLALSRLDVDFTLLSEGRELVRLPKGESLSRRLGRGYGRQLEKALIEVSWGAGPYRVEGVVADPDYTRRDSTMELLYINGRLAKDRGAGFAIRQAYKERLLRGRHPVYFLSLWLPPSEVDVNVHPTKSEVRFGNARRACGMLFEAVHRALKGRGGTGAPSLEVGGQGGELPRARSGLPDLPQDLFGREPGAAPRTPAASWPKRSTAKPGTADELRETAQSNPFANLRPRTFLQVRDLYLVFEGRDGLVVVDQHALHERVLYEKLRARHDQDQGNPKIQRLLMPVVLEVPPIDKAWLLEVQEVLAEEGFLIEDFGGKSIAIHGLPALLGRANPQAVLETFLAGDGEPRGTMREIVLERFHSMACRAAVMSGDRLGEEEIRALLEEAQKLQHPHNCPHGRPTVLTFSTGELEKYFRRRT